MMKGISLHSAVPVRTEEREDEEMSKQMLFAERCEILDEQPRWYRIRLCQDGQEGWVDKKMLTPLSAEEEQKLPAEPTAMVLMPMAYAVSENNGQTIPLTAGTRLCNYKDGRFELLGVGFRIDPSMVLMRPYLWMKPHLLQAVRFFLNIPYLWGGKECHGMDCSGFHAGRLSLFGKTCSATLPSKPRRAQR